MKRFGVVRQKENAVLSCMSHVALITVIWVPFSTNCDLALAGGRPVYCFLLG